MKIQYQKTIKSWWRPSISGSNWWTDRLNPNHFSCPQKSCDTHQMDPKSIQKPEESSPSLQDSTEPVRTFSRRSSRGPRPQAGCNGSKQGTLGIAEKNWDFVVLFGHKWGELWFHGFFVVLWGEPAVLWKYNGDIMGYWWDMHPTENIPGIAESMVFGIFPMENPLLGESMENILSMVAKSCTTWDGRKPINNGMFATY